MKKRMLFWGAAAAMTAAMSMQAFASGWQQNENGWWYGTNADNTSWYSSGWQWIDGNGDQKAECYYFNENGYLLTSAVTPDNYTVNADGAWVIDGVVQTQTVTLKTGWHEDQYGWKYYTGDKFLTSQWRTIQGSRYYFDDIGHMVTGFQEIDGYEYYFDEDGVLKKKDFYLDGFHYIVNSSNGRIQDMVDEYDWDEYQKESSNSSKKNNSSQNSSSKNDDDANNNVSEEPEEGELALDFAEEVVNLVNEERAKEGLPALSIDSDAESAAQIRAMELESSFSHTRPDGRKFSTALVEAGIDYRSAGENIAWGQRSPQEVVEDWMNSSGHRANILNSNYTSIGVGCYRSASGGYYWTQLFFRPWD